jgi:hypothetical protein
MRRDKKKPMGAVTFNHHVRAIRGFTRWAVATGRIPYCPLQSLARLNPKPERRHKRRSLSSEEYSKFLKTVKESLRVDKGKNWTFNG